MKDIREYARSGEPSRTIGKSEGFPGEEGVTTGKRIVIFDLKNLNFSSNQRFLKEDWVDGKFISTLLVEEIQPDVIIDFVRKFKTLLNLVSTTGGDFNSRVIQPALEELKNAWNFTDIDNSGARINDRILGDPIDLYKDLVAGDVVAHYELPYFGEKYICANGQNGWKSGADNEGFIVEQTKKFIQHEIPVDIASLPEWNNSNPIDAEPISVEFLLINSNLNNLISHFLFINSFAAGAFWLQDGILQRASNLYHINLRGYFNYFFCSANIRISNYGNYRRLWVPRYADEGDKDAYAHFNEKTGASITNDTVFPDAYRVNVEFKPMIPNNFNVFLNNLKSNNLINVGRP